MKYQLSYKGQDRKKAEYRYINADNDELAIQAGLSHIENKIQNRGVLAFATRVAYLFGRTSSRGYNDYDRPVAMYKIANDDSVQVIVR